MEKGDTFERMKRISAYFKNHAESNPLFKIEFEISARINTLICGLEELTISDIKEMISKINETEKQNHYVGSGWTDYKMHLFSLIKINGFQVLHESKDKMIIRKVASKG